MTCPGKHRVEAEVQLQPFATLELEVLGGQHHSLAALLLGKTWYPLYSRLGGSQGWSGRDGKSRSHRVSIPRLQPVVSCYTDYVMPAILLVNTAKFQVSSSPVTSLEWPRGFQEVKFPRFHDNGTEW